METIILIATIIIGLALGIKRVYEYKKGMKPYKQKGSR